MGRVRVALGLAIFLGACGGRTGLDVQGIGARRPEDRRSAALALARAEDAPSLLSDLPERTPRGTLATGERTTPPGFCSARFIPTTPARHLQASAMRRYVRVTRTTDSPRAALYAGHINGAFTSS